MRFKVGDRVRRIKEASGWSIGRLAIGTIGTVNNVNENFLGLQEFPRIDPVPFNAYFFELVSESTLDDLAERATQALKALKEAGHQHFECRFQQDAWSLLQDVCGFEFRVKPQPTPTFEPYQMRHSNHEVKPGPPGYINVGCQQFFINDLRIALQRLCYEHCDRFHSGDVRLTASRAGVKYGHHQISWTEADELLTKLEKLK